jgi:hypothetical protein
MFFLQLETTQVDKHKNKSCPFPLPKFIKFFNEMGKIWLICNMYGFGKKKTSWLRHF